jgi:hypothetical protein
MDYLLAGSLGGLVAFFFALPAIVLEITERGKVKNVPLLTDIKTIFGIKIRHKHEVFFIGLLLHLVLGFFFGLTYIYFVAQGWLLIVGASYSLASFLVFALLSWVVAGLVIYPLLGLGVFGKKEGGHVWLETIISYCILGVGLWLLVQYYQPIFFT